jgi:serine O-acetyltransferase
MRDKNIIKALMRNRTFRFQVAFRMCNGGGIIKLVGLIMWMFNKTRRTIQLPRDTKVGYGLYIGHGGPLLLIRLQL